MRHAFVRFAVLLAGTGLVLAQDKVPAPKPLRVHIIGASVSGGFRDSPALGAKEFGDSVTLQHVLKAWTGEHARTTTHNPSEMLVMFTNPVKIGTDQIQGALKAKPDVVVAIDFPFWFAYGFVGGDEGEERKKLLESGLELLGKLEMPVLLGTIPDMHGAAVRMLSPAQIPSPEVLKRLNEQLAAFVAARKNFHLVPLAELVRTMKDKGVSLPLADGALQTAPGALLQADRLHATRLGMALLGHTLQDPLRQLFPEGHALRTQQWTFEQFVEATGAEGDLEAVRDAAKVTNGGAEKPEKGGNGK